MRAAESRSKTSSPQKACKERGLCVTREAGAPLQLLHILVSGTATQPFGSEDTQIPCPGLRSQLCPVASGETGDRASVRRPPDIASELTTAKCGFGFTDHGPVFRPSCGSQENADVTTTCQRRRVESVSWGTVARARPRGRRRQKCPCREPGKAAGREGGRWGEPRTGPPAGVQQGTCPTGEVTKAGCGRGRGGSAASAQSHGWAGVTRPGLPEAGNHGGHG